MGVEVLALSLSAPTSPWDRISSSLQASTRGTMEVAAELKVGSVTCLGSCDNRLSTRPFGTTNTLPLCPGFPKEPSKSSKKFAHCRPYASWNESYSLSEVKGTHKRYSSSVKAFVTAAEAQDSSKKLIVDNERVGVLLLNLGGPESLNDVQPFLFNLFADPDIIRLPKLFRFLQKPLAQFVSVLRAPKSKEGYASIGGGSPLRKITDAQAEELRKSLEEKDVPAKVYVGMRYWHPFTEEAIEQIKKDSITKLVVLPLYPQFSISTSGSSLRLLESIFREDEYLVNMKHTVIPSWYQRDGYIKAMANLIEKELQTFDNPGEVMIFFSAHGVPVAYVEEAGDPYKAEMEECVDLIMEELDRRRIRNAYTLAYQSRVGPVEWLKPYTDETIIELGQKGTKSLLAVPISFVSEHIETLEEIDVEYKELALNSGIKKWGRVPALGCEPTFISDLADAVIESLPYVGAMAVYNIEARQPLVPLGSVEELLATYDSQRRELPPPVVVWEWGWTKSAETWNGRAAMLAVLVLVFLEVTTGQGLLHQWGVLPSFQQILDEVEIRELLIDHVGHRCCWGSRPSRKWKILKVEDCNVYVGTLETFIEERESIPQSAPYTGGKIDGKENGPQPGLWEVDLKSQFPPLFVPQVQSRLKVPHSEAIEKCSGCSGRGKIACPTCNVGQDPGFYQANQTTSCLVCHGRGLIAHSDGSDTICTNCTGKGKLPCASCGSHGLIKCQMCNGEGSLLACNIALVRWRTFVTRKVSTSRAAASVPDEVFHRARGVQLCNTQAYQCTPAFFADSFLLNRFSSEVIADRSPIPPTARVICERHIISVVPVTRVTMSHRDQSFSFYIIGLTNEIYIKDYPARFCWGLCPCLNWLS